MKRWFLGFFAVCVLCIGFETTSFAQDAGGNTEDAAATDVNTPENFNPAQALLNDIDRLTEEIDRIKTELAKAKAHDKPAFEKQVDEERQKLRVTLSKVPPQFKIYPPDEAMSARYKATLDKESKRLARDLTKAKKGLNKTRKTLESAKDDAQFELEHDAQNLRASISNTLKAWLAIVLLKQGVAVNVEKELDTIDTTLNSRAERIAGEINLLLDKRTTAPQPDSTKDDAKAQTQRVQKQLDAQVQTLQDTIELMKQRNLETARYQQLMITATGNITADVLDTKVTFGLFESWIIKAKTQFLDQGPTLLFKLILIVIILLLAKALSPVARWGVRKLISKTEVSQLLQDFLVSLSGKLVILAGVFIALAQMGIDVTTLLAGLGVVGFVVGFALQDTLANFASGAMILLYRPFDVGDLVETGGGLGTVHNMTLVSTTILTLDNQRVIIPNNKIWRETITNLTAEEVRRVDMIFGISYSDDIQHAEKVLAEILTECSYVLDTPEPVIAVDNLGASSVDFVVRPWTDPETYWECYWAVTREVKLRFDKEGLSFPFPQQDVHLYTQPKPPEDET